MTLQQRRRATRGWIVCLYGALLTVGVVTTANALQSSEDMPEALFESGHEALSRDNYRDAVEAFDKAYDLSRDSTFAARALYWQAFALYRIGSMKHLRKAEERLDLLLSTYDPSVSRGDAAELLTRIRGELARVGDAAAAEQIAVLAARLQAEESRRAAEMTRQEAEMFRQEAQKAHQEAQVVAMEAQFEASERAKMLAAEQYELAWRLQALRPTVLIEEIRFPADRDLEFAEEDIRIAALNALALMDEDLAVPIVMSVLKRRDKDSAGLRRKAVLLLALHPSPATTPLLHEVVRSDPDVEVRAQAVAGLAVAMDDASIALLAEIAVQEEDIEIRERAIRALSQRTESVAAAALRDVAADDAQPEDIREHAIRGLGMQGGEENLAFLRQIYDDVDDEALKEVIVMNVGHQDPGESRAWLVELVGDETQPMAVREKAFFWLGHDRESPTESLIALYDKLEDTDLRRQAIFVIAQRQDPAAIQFALRIASEESDPALRRAAIFWLGASGDPKAAEYLRQLLEE